MVIGIRQKVEQGDAEHQTGHEADRHLQARVGKPDENGQPTARQRGYQHEPAINRQQPTGRNHAPVIFNSVASVEFGVWTAAVSQTSRSTRVIANVPIAEYDIAAAGLRHSRGPSR